MPGKNEINKRGNFICSVGYLRIYQKIDTKITGVGRNKVVESTATVNIYHSRHLMMGDLKSIEEAKAEAKKLVAKREMQPSIRRK